jgi:hypothetical protein
MNGSLHLFKFPGDTVVVSILLVAAMLVSAQAQKRSAAKVSKGDGVPNWDVTASCRAAGQVATAGQAGDREKSCIETEHNTRDKLAADWSTFPAEERARCIKSIEWFSPTYTELAACLDMYSQVKNLNEPTPNKPQR